MTWARAGQAERVRRTWADQGTNYTAAYTWSLLGLSGYSNNGISEPKTTTSVTSWIIRDPAGTPIAQRYTNGNEYYYLFDGQGDVVGLEDPGTMQAAYDFCPTGNEADLASTTPTTVALGNPLRLNSEVYDDLTKDYFGTCGCIWEDYSGTSTQGPAFTNGDVLLAAALPGGGGNREVVVDANILIYALDRGQIAQVDAALGGRAPVVPLQAATEYINAGGPKVGDAFALLTWLRARGGRFTPNGSLLDVARLELQARSLGRTIRVKDAVIVGAAQRQGLDVLTGDIRLYKFLQDINYPSQLYSP